ncbi:MAG: DNA adenine methylase [Anaerolineaceae bacterium]|nr:DNA adenine methylase [Anaerolineaceae bacterium]
MTKQQFMQLSFYENEKPIKFPSTRYQGSKKKLLEWILSAIKDLEFDTCLDAFGGTGSVAFELKRLGKSVTYNDILKFNYLFGKALIENNTVTLSNEEINWILQSHSHFDYPDFVYKTFPNTYFTDDENIWIDKTITNIRNSEFDEYKSAIAFFALSQSCIVKRPYNLFHRKNLYMRLSDVKRSFGNKTSWDKPFEEWFRYFCSEANEAIFDNGRNNKSSSKDAVKIDNKYDLVYIDTPYISQKGVGVDYRDFYHFLEGLTMYDEWDNHIDYKSKHRRLIRKPNPWNDKKLIHSSYEKLVSNFKDSILVVSYRSDGIPSEDDLIQIMKRYKDDVTVLHFGQYKYALSHNSKSKELLIIGQ